MRLLAFLLGLVCFFGGAINADTTDVVLPGDTTLFVPVPNDRDSAIVIDTTNLERHLTQNPTAALFKSLLVPGLGQFGNRKYFKAALFAGLEVWFISSAIDYNSKAQDYRTLYDASDVADERREFYSQYEDQRDQRNKYLWFTGITVFVSIFDAYVDAHLSGSPLSGKQRAVDLDVAPDGRGGTAVQLAIRF